MPKKKAESAEVSKRVTIHAGITHKIPLDQYENYELMFNISMEFNNGQVGATEQDLKEVDELQAQLTGLLVARVGGEEERVIKEWLERGKLKDLRDTHDTAKAAEKNVEAEAEAKKGKSLLGRKAGE